MFYPKLCHSPTQRAAAARIRQGGSSPFSLIQPNFLQEKQTREKALREQTNKRDPIHHRNIFHENKVILLSTLFSVYFTAVLGQDILLGRLQEYQIPFPGFTLRSPLPPSPFPIFSNSQERTSLCHCVTVTEPGSVPTPA